MCLALYTNRSLDLITMRLKSLWKWILAVLYIMLLYKKVYPIVCIKLKHALDVCVNCKVDTEHVI